MTEEPGRGQLSAGDLNLAEQFVLWALRTRLEGAAKRAHLEHGFRLARDPATGDAALRAFEPWFAVLAGCCWRDLYLHHAACPCLSGDERAMLDLVRSAQEGDATGLDRLAAGLVHPRATGLLQDASGAFAAALCRLGLHLSGHKPPPGRDAARLH
jgi:hypothetical protein